MMAEQGVLSIFGYAYRPMVPMQENDGGFTVNLLENDVLVFSQYNTRHQVLQEFRFQLPPEVRQRYLALVSQARPWMGSVPPLMRPGEDSVSEYTFCFCGYPVFRIEDMVQLMDCPFRSIRGHYTRLVYGLMESISILLLHCGIDLQPNSFTWNQNVIRPLVPMNYYSTYA